MRVKLSEIAAACGGTLIGAENDPVITGFATDSREAGAGILFVPIQGERADGHDYISAAFENGCPAAFSERDPVPGGAVIQVTDCRAALQKTAAWYRSRFSCPIVGITGSVGKTTLKEMVAQALSAGFKVHKTAGNRNSQLGVPVTVCGMEKNHTAAVIEMGISMPGEMSRISTVVKPTCAVISNIGVSHIEYLKTRENIMAEKAHIADHLPQDGVLFVNGNDDLLPTLKNTANCKVITYGLSPQCDWRASALNEADKGTFFTCTSPGGDRIELFVPAAGAHNVQNALAAMAVAQHLGIPAENAARALAAYKSPAMRQQIAEVGGLTVIDDSYNASPDSMRSALNVLETRRTAGKRVAVLADMLELGSFAEEGHRSVGQYAKQHGVNLLVAVGQLAAHIAAGFGDGARHVATNEEAIRLLKEQLSPGDAVLVKGSRGMHTEEIVQAIKESLGAEE